MGHSFIELWKFLHHNKAVLWFSNGPYGCESWIIKKIECQTIDAFELPCWRRLLKVSWTARRLNQSILREINPENSLEGQMLKLKLQYFCHLRQTDDKSSEHIKKQRHYFANKGPSSQSYVLSIRHVWIWELNHKTNKQTNKQKNTECQRIDPFEMWCWKRLLRVPCPLRISNQALLKETNPEHSLEGLMLRLTLQYLGHLMWRKDSL